VLIELNPFRNETVHVRCLDFALAVCGYVVVPASVSPAFTNAGLVRSHPSGASISFVLRSLTVVIHQEHDNIRLGCPCGAQHDQ
jgi:hypothetical protein